MGALSRRVSHYVAPLGMVEVLVNHNTIIDARRLAVNVIVGTITRNLWGVTRMLQPTMPPPRPLQR